MVCQARGAGLSLLGFMPQKLKGQACPQTKHVIPTNKMVCGQNKNMTLIIWCDIVPRAITNPK